MQGAGLTEPFHAVWLRERALLADRGCEDWFFTENSSAYPIVQRQVEPLQETHDVKFVCVCSSELGFPMRRNRTFSFGFDKAKWVWVGPEGEALQSQFNYMFNSPCQLPGDVYMVADTASVLQFARDTAAQRGRQLPAGFEECSMRSYLTCLLPPGGMVRFADYDKVRDFRQDLAGHYMAHLDHNTGCGPASGPEMPCLDTHATIYSWKEERLVLGSELLGAQGIDMFPEIAADRGLSPLHRVFQHFKDSERHPRAVVFCLDDVCYRECAKEGGSFKAACANARCQRDPAPSERFCDCRLVSWMASAQMARTDSMI